MSEEKKDYEALYNEERERANGLEERARRFEGELVDVKKTLEPFKGLDIERLQADAEAYHNMKKDDAVGGTEEERRAFIDAEVAKAREKDESTINSLRERNQELESKYHQVTVVSEVMKQLQPAIHETALGDIEEIVARDFDSDDNGIFVRGNDGKPIYKEGTKRMSVDDWKNQQKEQRPHLFKSTAQGGAHEGGTSSNTTGRSNGRSISLDEYKQMDADQRKNVDPEQRRILDNEWIDQGFQRQL